MAETGAVPFDREERLTAWVRAYGEPILRTCFVYLLDRAQAEDAIQDTFRKAWKNMDQLAVWGFLRL